MDSLNKKDINDEILLRPVSNQVKGVCGIKNYLCWIVKLYVG